MAIVMKTLMANVFIVATVLFGTSAFAAVKNHFVIDPQVCVDKLEWNTDFTEARCVVRNAPISSGSGTKEINFSLPTGEGTNTIDGLVRPLLNGYVVVLRSTNPVVPDQIKSLLVWSLAQIAEGGLMRPGLCAGLLAEAKALRL